MCHYMKISVIMYHNVVGGHMAEHIHTCVYMYMIILERHEQTGACFFMGVSA